MTELQLQTLVFQWVWNQFPATRRLLVHVPNGGYRNKSEAMQMKASGVVKGVHDLLFYWKGQLYWFELKVGSNQQTPEQTAFGQAMIAQGAICHEIRDFDTFKHLFLKIIER